MKVLKKAKRTIGKALCLAFFFNSLVPTLFAVERSMSQEHEVEYEAEYIDSQEGGLEALFCQIVERAIACDSDMVPSDAFVRCYQRIEKGYKTLLVEDVLNAMPELLHYALQQYEQELNKPEEEPVTRSVRSARPSPSDDWGYADEPMKAPRPGAQSQLEPGAVVGPILVDPNAIDGECGITQGQTAQILKLLKIIKQRIGTVKDDVCWDTVLGILGDACEKFGPDSNISCKLLEICEKLQKICKKIKRHDGKICKKLEVLDCKLGEFSCCPNIDCDQCDTHSTVKRLVVNGDIDCDCSCDDCHLCDECDHEPFICPPFCTVSDGLSEIFCKLKEHDKKTWKKLKRIQCDLCVLDCKLGTFKECFDIGDCEDKDDAWECACDWCDSCDDCTDCPKCPTFDNVSDGLSEIFCQICEHDKRVCKKFKELEEIICDKFEFTWSLIEDLSDTVTECCDDIINTVTECCEEIIDTVTECCDELEKEIIETRTTIIDVVVTVSELMCEKFEFTWSLIEDIKETLTECCEEIIDTVTECCQDIIDTVTECCDDLADDIFDTQTILCKKIEDLNDTVTECCDDLADDIFDTQTILCKKIEDLTGTFTECCEEIIDTITECCEDIIETLTECCEDIIDTVTECCEDILEEIEETRSIICEKIEDLETTLTECCEDIIDTVTECCEDILEEIEETRSILCQKIEDLELSVTATVIIDLTSIFTTLVDLKETLTECCEDIIDTVTECCEDILDEIIDTRTILCKKIEDLDFTLTVDFTAIFTTLGDACDVVENPTLTVTLCSGMGGIGTVCSSVDLPDFVYSNSGSGTACGQLEVDKDNAFNEINDSKASVIEWLKRIYVLVRNINNDNRQGALGNNSSIEI